MIEGIYKIINFGVFVGFVVWFFRRNILNLIKKQLLVIKGSKEDLVRQEGEVQAELGSLKSRLDYQDSQYETLEKKILQWRSALNKDHEYKKREYETYEGVLKARLEMQIEYCKMIALGKKIIPHAIKDAKVDLVNKFQDGARMQSYSNHVLSLLTKNG